MLRPKNSSPYPSASHTACEPTQAARAEKPLIRLPRKLDEGRYSGSRTRYQRKYCEVQTLLNVAKANVWVRRVVGRWRLARATGRRTVQRRSWGRKAREDGWRAFPDEGVPAEVR